MKISRALFISDAFFWRIIKSSIPPRAKVGYMFNCVKIYREDIQSLELYFRIEYDYTSIRMYMEKMRSR